MRINSLKELGKGAWKVHPESMGDVSTSKSKKAQRISNENSGPHGKLWARVSMEWNNAVCEYENAVPGRRFRLDIGIPEYRLAIEVDGWEFHGKFKEGFHKDREKQNLLTEHNWRILRFTAKEIYSNLEGCIETIRRTLLVSTQHSTDLH
jgi:very-short-patch-repair endonuclease